MIIEWNGSFLANQNSSGYFDNVMFYSTNPIQYPWSYKMEIYLSIPQIQLPCNIRLNLKELERSGIVIIPVFLIKQRPESIKKSTEHSWIYKLLKITL